MKILLFLLIPIGLFAQEIPQRQEIKNERTWSVKLNVLQLVDAFAFPVVMVGTEKRINRWFSLNAEAGYQFYDGDKDPEMIIYKQRGVKANIEARSYVISMFNPNATKKARGFFAGIQFFYRQNQYTATDSYYDPDIDTPQETIYDRYGVRKTAYGFNICAGYQKASRHFLFEPYLAIGGMYRDVNNTQRIDNTGLQENYSEYFLHNDKSEDSGFTGNFTAGIRFGYIF